MANTQMTTSAVNTNAARIMKSCETNPLTETARAGGDPGIDLGSDSDPADTQETSGVDYARSPMKLSPTMNDFVNSVLLLDNTDQSLWTDLDGTNADTLRLLAVQYAPSQKVMALSYNTNERLIDETFRTDMVYTFPELYYKFIVAFGKRSSVHYHYCTRSLKAFRECFLGPDDLIQEITCWMQNEFDHAFRLCFESTSEEGIKLGVLSSSILDRVEIETRLFPSLVDETYEVYAFARENELTMKAVAGDIIPLAIWLKASKQSDRNVWARILPILVNQCRGRDQLMRFGNLVREYRYQTNNVVVDLRLFVQCLVDQKLYVRRSRGSNPNLSRAYAPSLLGKNNYKYAPKNFALKHQHPVVPAKGHGSNETIRLKPNGEPYLPFKEYVKKKREERKEQSRKNGKYIYNASRRIEQNNSNKGLTTDGTSASISFMELFSSSN